MSEINNFLETKSKEATANEKAREEVMEKIQKDLSERLNQSRDELAGIKTQMKGNINEFLCTYKYVLLVLFLNPF